MEEVEHIEEAPKPVEPEVITEKEVVVKSEVLEQDNSLNDDEALNHEEIGATDGSERSESGEISDGDSGTEMSGDEDQENVDDDNEDVIEEREEGDGQESVPSKKVDDDEDKRNPQYIPKKGTFYEHDDRTAVDEEQEEGEETEEAEKKDKGSSGEGEDAKAGKKKVWNEKEGSRWTHDKFNDSEQAPKSRSELVAIYGYDIRNEEGPPRPRRRRRYGRGPNKYTRNWEDEAAYNKGLLVKKPRAPRRSRGEQEEFPPLNRDEDDQEERAPSPPNRASEWRPKPTVPSHVQIVQQSAPQNRDNIQTREIKPSNGNIMQENREKPNPVMERREPPPNRHISNNPRPISGRRETFYQDNNPSLSRVVKSSRYSSNFEDTITRGRGITRARGWRGAGRSNPDPHSRRPRLNEENEEFIMSQNFINKNISSQQSNQKIMEEVERGVSNINIRENQNQQTRGGHSRGVSNVPPRLQQTQQESQRQGAPKRYSSLRQKSLPEMGVGAPNGPPQQQAPPANATFAPHHGPPPPTIIHYTPHTEFAQQGAVVSNSNQALIGGPGYAVAQYAQAPFAGTYTGPPQGINPAVLQAPPPGPPPPQIINFGPQPPPGPPQVAPPPAAQYNPAVSDYGAFPHQQFAPVNQTQGGDVYHHPAQAGGITYYSMEQQQVMQMQRIQTQKRPKAAIPIVPPPELKEPRGRGRLQPQNEDMSTVGNDISNNLISAYEGEHEGVLIQKNPASQTLGFDVSKGISLP